MLTALHGYGVSVVLVCYDSCMEYRIVELPSFNFVGVSRRVRMQFEGVNQEIVELAASITEEQGRAMHALMDLPPHEVVNISYDSDTSFTKEEGCLTHMIGVLTTSDDIPSCLEVKPYAASKWVVFPSNGAYPDAMQETMAASYAIWFPSHPEYRLAEPLSFLFARLDDQGGAYSEVWMPVCVDDNMGIWMEH